MRILKPDAIPAETWESDLGLCAQVLFKPHARIPGTAILIGDREHQRARGRRALASSASRRVLSVIGVAISGRKSFVTIKFA